MTAIEPQSLPGRLRAFLIELGLPELVGGRAAFDAGVDALSGSLLAVAAELVLAARSGTELDEAVFDVDRFPHTAELHGGLANALEQDVPAELEQWARKLAAAGRWPDVPEMNRAIAAVSTTSPNVLHRSLARFALFELLTLNKRLLLRAGRVQLEVLNGRRRDVEVLAACEVRVACELARSNADLLSVEDPISLLGRMAAVSLSRYVEILRAELAEVTTNVHDQMERRKRILAAAARVGPADAVLILNETADEFGEERLTAMQLRRANPGLLGDLSDAAIYKRVERLPGKVVECERRAARSLADVLVEMMEEAAT